MHMTTTAREQTIKRLVERGMVPQMLCKFGCGSCSKLGLLEVTPASNNNGFIGVGRA